MQELVYGGRVKQDNSAMISNVRHISLYGTSKAQVEQALSSIDMGMPVDFIATDLRSAWELLGDITGDTIRESMIDELFSRFCLGKLTMSTSKSLHWWVYPFGIGPKSF